LSEEKGKPRIAFSRIQGKRNDKGEYVISPVEGDDLIVGEGEYAIHPEGGDVEVRGTFYILQYALIKITGKDEKTLLWSFKEVESKEEAISLWNKMHKAILEAEEGELQH